MNPKFKVGILIIFVALIALGVTSNVMQQRAVDNSKIPSKVETNKLFQRWITNVKNRNLPIEADMFRLKEENEIYNSKWTVISTIEQPGALDKLNASLAAHQNIRGVVFAPSKREFLDYRSIDRDGYKSNEVRFYGQKESNIIDTKVVDCSLLANCVFDRAFFLNNDYFVISELSRNIDKKDTTAPNCSKDQSCTYTFKLHVVDQINNTRYVYESVPFEAVLSTLITQL